MLDLAVAVATEAALAKSSGFTSFFSLFHETHQTLNH